MKTNKKDEQIKILKSYIKASSKLTAYFIAKQKELDEQLLKDLSAVDIKNTAKAKIAEISKELFRG